MQTLAAKEFGRRKFEIVMLGTGTFVRKLKEKRFNTHLEILLTSELGILSTNCRTVSIGNLTLLHENFLNFF